MSWAPCHNAIGERDCIERDDFLSILQIQREATWEVRILSHVAFVLQEAEKKRMVRRIRNHSGNQSCDQHKEDTHDTLRQKLVSTDLQALFIGGRRLRKWRSDNPRDGRYPACPGTGGQNLAKSSQISGFPKGRANVRQLQAFHTAELVPDRRWNDQSERLVFDLSESLLARL
jgi:hypothetical protein